MKISNLDIKGLKCIKYKVLPILIAGTIGISLSACGDNKKDCASSDNSSYTSDYSLENHNTVYDETLEVDNNDITTLITTAPNIPTTTPIEEYEPSVELNDYDLDNLMVKLNQEDRNNLKKFFSSINSGYKDSDLFNVKEALNIYENMNLNTTVSNKLIKNNKINKELFYNVVTENNKEFLKNDKTNKYYNIEQNKLKEIIDIVVEHIDKLLIETEGIDINNLDRTYKKLKILEFKSFGNAVVDMEDPKLCLNFIAINSLQNNNPNIDMLTMTVKHESSHLIQVSYPLEEEFKYNMGISYSYSDLKVNPLYWQWFVEGSAEKLTLNKTNDVPFNYRDQVKGLESITLANITTIDNVNDVEKTSLKRDLNNLFELFNVTTDEEKQEIINMMFSYDIIFSENKEFVELCKERKGKFDLLNLYDYKDELKASIGSTLTKVFYNNLSNTLVKQESSLEDIYLLMRTFENELCRITDYDNTTKNNVNSKFINNYNNIQTAFFDTLSNNLNIESTALKELYCLYSDDYCKNAKFKNEENYNIDINIEWLDEGKNDFLEQISKSRVYHINKNINR